MYKRNNVWKFKFIKENCGDAIKTRGCDDGRSHTE